MSGHLFAPERRWVAASVAAFVAALLVAGFVGFVLLPRAHARDATASLWESICSAAGAPLRGTGAAAPAQSGAVPTQVVVANLMLETPDPAAVGRGATLAAQCSACHGARGAASAAMEAPHLAGQPSSALYKQLRDFKSGHRPSLVMAALAASLSEADMRDLAAFYAVQQRATLVAHAGLRQQVPRLVSNGAPLRNIGACMACHSPAVGRVATPILDGLPEAYLRDQLAAFKSGRRANDIHRQMRNVARGMREDEIALVARYYARR